MLPDMDLLTKLKELFASLFYDESQDSSPRQSESTMQPSSGTASSLSDPSLHKEYSYIQAILLIKQALTHLEAHCQSSYSLVDSLKKELSLQQRNQEQQINATIEGALLSFYKDVADPVTQLVTLNHLIEEGKPVKPEDIVVHARLLIAALNEHGLSIEGSPGQVVPYNPNFHEPLSTNESPSVGEPVFIRFPGASFKGQVIKKAGIQIRENS